MIITQKLIDTEIILLECIQVDKSLLFNSMCEWSKYDVPTVL